MSKNISFDQEIPEMMVSDASMETEKVEPEQEETDQELETAAVMEDVPKPNPFSRLNFSPWMAGCGILLFFVILEAILLFRLRRKLSGIKEKQTALEEKTVKEVEVRSPEPVQMSGKPTIHIGKLHHIGKRQNQQDSFGVAQAEAGIFAVVADGMGGLSDGDKVSQKIVRTMLDDASRISSGQLSSGLFTLAAHANSEINQMLGYERQYQCGSTVIAVLADERQFQWVSVGDSRICLYRGGKLLQINREHIYISELLEKAVNHEITFAEAYRHAKRNSLTSFIGMGELKYVDGSLRPVEVQRGDRILLMSDGVFHTVSEENICAVLKKYPIAEQAAAELEQQVLMAQNPKQDNFTAVLICYD